MSVRLMTKVWEESPYEGAKLLLHLALADFASDEGYCWPSISTLAKKIRRSERHTTRLISEMEKDGIVERHLRPYTSNLYKVSYTTTLLSGVSPKSGGDDIPDTTPLSPMSANPSLIHQRSITANSPNLQALAEEIEYVDLDDFEGTARPKWQIPETPIEVEFLSVCNAKWYKPGQKKKVKAIMAAIRAGDILGDDVYSRCYDELQDIPDLMNRNLPPMPQSWLEWRAEHAVSNRWSVDGFIRALLDRDALVKHCRYKMKELGKTPGKIVNGMYIIEIPEGGPK